ncbi:MAG: membrane protein insertion efficiency factor YidD [Candidatus Yanofskybacteria bacterium CG10_big_fil_rev_8_21_14_0_10_37_15]|uniref:Putative membrane protein insertion efficiency factor n=1 Tax=Candidatus Yanofskybacteria bacterium CG10_big_fil_rev_8_21_14_0_10_37_15 TaxID=1975097 RepID=A0A2H0R7D7_9BACT|nr:MAG: membrane protein insertion efficiency factor YidD [Candidatus Yanofskybacteria bacterium CG10_big_fil_rev_8_21_14_0_10_37_15]
MKKNSVKIISFYRSNSINFWLGIPFILFSNCKYHPTCSDYAIHAINKHGFFKGFGKGILRILKCNPFSRGGVDLP